MSLQKKYQSDLEEDFGEEAVQFGELLQHEKVSRTSAAELLKMLRLRKLHTLMSVEQDILRELDFQDIIKAFSSKKTRRKNF